MHGRYCHVCGQENIEPKESFWHLVTHFVYDVTHFDGKFFSTLKYLLFKPGFLSHEYLRGRRAAYLHPIRMYVFTSAFFFLIFFSINGDEEIVKVKETEQPATAAQVMKKLDKDRRELAKELNDSVIPERAKEAIRIGLTNTDSNIALLKRDSTAKNRLTRANNNQGFNFILGDKSDTTIKAVHVYDSVQKQLPADKRDNFFKRKIRRQNIHLQEKYNGDSKAIWTAVAEKFKHLFPQMLFVSLPLFALMLRLLYVRRKNFFYVNHVVFTIHLYCGTFIIILAGILIDYLVKLTGYTGEWVGFIFTMAGFFYWYKSMRNFYEQRRAKTILKYFLVLFLSIFIMSFIFTVFAIFSAMAI